MRKSENIFLDINESNLIFEYDLLTFYFSSDLYLNKFKQKYVDYIKQEQLKFTNKYKINIEFDYIFLISLYKQIENRGFKVTFKNKPLTEQVGFSSKITL